MDTVYAGNDFKHYCSILKMRKWYHYSLSKNNY